MRKIRVIAAILTVFPLLFISGCGNQPTTQAIYTAVPTEAILVTTANAPCIQVYDTVLELGKSTVEDIVNAGALFSSNGIVKSIDYSEDPLFTRTLTFVIGPTSITVTAKNMQNAISPIKNSILQSAYFSGRQVCGTGGVMVGDSIETLSQKLGEPYLLVNSEEYRIRNGGAAMDGNTRVYAYASQFDDITMAVCVDRNSYTVTKIDEWTAKNLVTEPKQVDDNQIRRLVKTFKNQLVSGSMTQALLDNLDSKGNHPSGPVSSISFNRMKVLTLNRIKDSKAFYKEQANFYDKAIASTYLIIEYDAIITLYKGTENQIRKDVTGCFYIPGAYLTDEGEVACGLTNIQYKQSGGVYESEDTMLESIFEGNSQGYRLSDFTAMERNI
ncbi:MAG: hypothetical protein IJ899_20055 [Blautia sp.]|nr:hypothetical protein [Blautia sp.]